MLRNNGDSGSGFENGDYCLHTDYADSGDVQ